MISIDFQLDWKPNFQFAGLLYAHHEGWYTKAGIDLRFIPWQGLTNPLDALKSNGRVIASAEENLIIRERANETPIWAIGSMLQYSPIGWMALEDSGIKELKDLKGKRLGIHGDGKMAVEAAMEYFGMQKKEIEIIEIGYEYGDILKNGECDAVQCLVMAEPLELKEHGFHLSVMPAYQWGYESYCQIMTVPEKFLDEESGLLEDFLKITFDGWRAALENIHTVAGWITKKYLPDTDSSLEAKMLEAFIPFIEGKIGRSRIGWMETSRWERSIQNMVKHGMIDQPLQSEDVMTNGIVESIYRGVEQ